MSDGSPAAGELRTARLWLRRPAEADIDAIFAIHHDPGTCLHNPSDALSRPDEAEALYRRWNDQWQRCGYGYWVVRRHDSDQPLGFCGIKPMELQGMKALNLFYRFATSAWGQGYASEAATAVADWASPRFPDLPLIARVRPANIASQRVAIRAGLTRAEHLDGTGYDGLDWIYAANLRKPRPADCPTVSSAREIPALFQIPASGDGLVPDNSCSSGGGRPRPFPVLVVIRGNSASGKSAVAAAIRARHASRDLAIVSQDTLRRDILRERDIPGGANINLLKLTARHAVDCGFSVIVEGILRTDYYGSMLAELINGHPGPAFAYYLDIPFKETLLRHASKPQAAQYGEAEMRDWYRERDLLPGGIEHVITAESSLEDTVATIMTDTGLGSASHDQASG